MDTVVIHSNRPIANWLYEFGHVWYNAWVARESVEAGMEDFKNISGTGPWIWTEYVAGSFSRFERNPNFHETITFGGEEFQLPFMDEIQVVVMPQLATRLSSLRTGKISYLDGVSISYWETLDTEPLSKTAYAYYGSTMFFACDTPPLDNIEVRRALNMAINRQEFIDMYFLGAALWVGFPMSPSLPDIYIPFEEMPADVQDYYTYQPDKAEQILDAEGHPRDPATGQRFSLTVILPSAAQTTHEVSEVVASYWEEIGVELVLEPLEQAALLPRVYDGPYDICFDWWGNTRLTALNDFKMGNQWNRSNLTDPLFNEMWDDVMTTTDPELFPVKMKEVIAYWFQLVPGFMGPSPQRRAYWAPWLKGHSGEREMGFGHHTRRWNYSWIDQDLRDEMGQ
jgi:peptide/nickel transport system substrate-binding protein